MFFETHISKHNETGRIFVLRGAGVDIIYASYSTSKAYNYPKCLTSTLAMGIQNTSLLKIDLDYEFCIFSGNPK